MCLASTKVEDRPHRGTIVLDGDIQRGTRAEHLLLRAGSGICFGIQERLRNLGVVEYGGPLHASRTQKPEQQAVAGPQRKFLCFSCGEETLLKSVGTSGNGRDSERFAFEFRSAWATSALLSTAAQIKGVASVFIRTSRSARAAARAVTHPAPRRALQAKWSGLIIGNAVWAWTLARASMRRLTTGWWLQAAAIRRGV